jgi:sphinganine C4-monooxygenase
VPYSYGALYSSLVEAFVVDTIGTTVTFYLSGLAIIPATCFASLSIIKSVNDHSGYRFPYNPFDYLSSNTTEFHDVHHQNWGMKYNYSQIYLTLWDDLLGTTMPAKEVASRRKGGVNASAILAKNGKTE